MTLGRRKEKSVLVLLSYLKPQSYSHCAQVCSEDGTGVMFVGEDTQTESPRSRNVRYSLSLQLFYFIVRYC